VAIANNGKVFDLLFVLNRLMPIDLRPEFLVRNGQIMCLELKNVTWLESLNYMPMTLR